MLTKARAKTKKIVFVVSLKKKSIMNSPRRPLFPEIKYIILLYNILAALIY